jgi:L-alanine-DL-glutamate epimerase-like enolase superfamily enzyme
MELAAPKIEEVQAFWLKMPLNVPYHLSLGEVEHFDLFLVRARVEDVEGLGETVPLPGYSRETDGSVWELLREWTKRLPGMEAGEAPRELAPVRRRHPFATTAIATAIETAIHPLELSEEIRVPLLGTVMTHREDRLEDEVESLLRQGYTTLKVKVGWEERDDASRVRRVQEIAGDRAMIRIDANQAYDLDQALYLVHHVDPANIELFEQPFPAGDWGDMVRLSKESPLPLMLDESIDSEAELEEMIRLRCAGVVKFKLMKAGGLAELERLILRAEDAGLKVVLGNGVAGDIGNFHELVMAGRHVETAGEMNGFLKQERRLLSNPYDVSQGGVTLPRGYAPRMDWSRIRSYAVESIRAGGIPLKTEET